MRWEKNPYKGDRCIFEDEIIYGKREGIASSTEPDFKSI
jgi:hypothetical protein